MFISSRKHGFLTEFGLNMDPLFIDTVLKENPFFIDDVFFYSRVFSLLSKKERSFLEPSSLKRLLIDDADELSRRFDRADMRESSAVRNRLRAQKLAELLIDSAGNLDIPILENAVLLLKENLYSIGPGREDDAQRQEHLLGALTALLEKKELQLLIKKFARPLSEPRIEEVLRNTLVLSENEVLTDAHVQRAVLSAWFSYLRQNVGSCFATAPAGMIQEEQPERFLQDLLDLISTGQLKRTFEGEEKSVPLSPGTGSGDLKRSIKLYATEKGIFPEVWYSPGLIESLEKVGILKGDLKEKIETLKNLLEPLILSKLSHKGVFFTTPEEILHAVIMGHFEITESMLQEDLKKRPSFESLAFSAGTDSRKKKKEEKIAAFKKMLVKAGTLYKSFSENALLKAWEYTLASFSETKYEFTEWNLYTSLGMRVEEKGGIGQCIYEIIQSKIDTVNLELKEKQEEYEIIFTQVKTIESRMRHISTEQELQWVKLEYQAKSNELSLIKEQFEALKARSESLVNLYETVYRLYKSLFKEYFQEVYDPDMQEVGLSLFDDAPAGFRLLYKHGRSRVSQWTLIKDPQEFIEALSSFFTSTESMVLHELEGKEIERDLTETITAIVKHIRTKEFLETAFQRMAVAHGSSVVNNPLENLSRIEKKPWAYVSGGKMTTLISTYYKFNFMPTLAEKWVENEMELLVFIADSLKAIPSQFIKPYLEGKKYSLLMESPTHAFRLLPMLDPFFKTWQSEAFTYTDIRDEFVKPMESFVENVLLDAEMIRYLVDALAEKIPYPYRSRFLFLSSRLQAPLNPIFFKEGIAEILLSDKGFIAASDRFSAVDEVDRLLYACLPFVPTNLIKKSLEKVFSALPEVYLPFKEKALELYDPAKFRSRYGALASCQLQLLCKTLLHAAAGRSFFPINVHESVALAARKSGLSMPSPLIFADTNWSKYYFAFVVSPGSGRLELWRMNKIGTDGFPMSTWKEWLNGTRSDIKWGIYIKPVEYGQS